ncbi:MAG: Serine--tRNA ligase [Elusimicrobia bacterium ADurb.Bin231]|nr:MAG: Serine--tRNA ligase [Elusimicrobia bacterium ADurb.Bin231]
MIDIKIVRENPDLLERALKNRNSKFELQEIISLDTGYRKLLKENEELKSQRNKASAEISSNPPDKQALILQMQEIKQKIKSGEEKVKQMDSELTEKLLYMPNIPDSSVPVGKSAEDNVVVGVCGVPKQYDFKPLDHHLIGEALRILDFSTAAKISGSRFAVLVGDGARLERALINFMIDVHTGGGYKEIFPPFVVDKKCLTGTGQLPKFEEELYKCSDNEYLIPTAEVPLTNMHREEILDYESLPLKYVAYTACFRREAGSYGKDTRGLIRNHQFDKIELVKFSAPEKSFEELEKMVFDACEVLKRLEIPYRVVLLCSGDMGFSSAKTYDLEVWMPGESKWREISSVSNCTDFQARRINCKMRREKKLELVHTLNGSGVAVGRLFAAILENYQNKDGSVTIPSALVKYFGKEKIA